MLLFSLLVRLFGIGWGIPDYDAALMPYTPYRHSYHIDEDNFLWGLMQMKPSTGSFDIVDYHWGSLQHYLIYGALLCGSLLGVVPAPWETAFAQGNVEALARIFIVGRMVSVIMGVACTGVVMSLGTIMGGRVAGLGAGVAYAIAPFAVMGAHYLTNDVPMSALVAASVLSGVWAVRRGSLRFTVLAGLLLGLAVANKYSAIFAAPALLAAQWAIWRISLRSSISSIRSTLLTILLPWLATVGGFLLGQPYALLKPGSLMEGLRMSADGNAIQVSGIAFVKEAFKMLGWQFANLAELGLTLPITLLALVGVGGMVKWAVSGRTSRRRADAGQDREGDSNSYLATIILCGIGGLVLGLTLNRVYVMRYSQPLVPLLSVAAGLAWASVPRAGLRWAVGGLSVLVAGLVTWGQLSLLVRPHPADSLQTWLRTNLRQGQQVARLWPEYPVLDERLYRLVRLDPWRPELPSDSRPDYIILDDMQFGPSTQELATLISQNYKEVVRFGTRPRIGSFEWDEGTTPHDWKYSHPTFFVYALNR